MRHDLPSVNTQTGGIFRSPLISMTQISEKTQNELLFESPTLPENDKGNKINCLNTRLFLFDLRHIVNLN
jgi:hypothetical protein